MKKSLLIAIVLVVGLLVGGCSSNGGSSSTSTSSATSTASEGTTGSVTSTSTTVGETSTDTSGGATTASSTTATTVKAHRYEQNDSHIVYSGAWTTSANAAASGGSFKYVDSAGGKVTITFEGTHLSLIAKKSSKYGKAMITLDGEKLGTIDLYNVDAKFQQKIWGTGTLKPGTHTVVIAWTGTKRSAAADTNINIDCVLVNGTLK